ncbi:MAG: FAD-dependent thymidylate synthase [Armatimonadota bacterium]
MGRIVVPEAEELLDKEIKVLDKGFVRLVDYLGGDQRIVQSARVSYGAGTKSYRQDRALIHYLLRNDHTSPFEQVTLTFHAKMPIFVARQWVRHRTARLNEISGRYSIMKDEFYVPEPDQMRGQSTDNKQARSEESLPDPVVEKMLAEISADQGLMYEHYEGMVEEGLAREVARINLPLSLYTEWYWQIDLHNLLRFLHLRMDSHAQYEIRVFAEAMATCAKAVAPMAYEAFEEHVLHGVRFSRSELVALNSLLGGRAHGLSERAEAIFQKKLDKMKALSPTEEPEALSSPSL